MFSTLLRFPLHCLPAEPVAVFIIAGFAIAALRFFFAFQATHSLLLAVAAITIFSIGHAP